MEYGPEFVIVIIHYLARFIFLVLLYARTSISGVFFWYIIFTYLLMKLYLFSGKKNYGVWTTGNGKLELRCLIQIEVFSSFRIFIWAELDWRLEI